MFILTIETTSSSWYHHQVSLKLTKMQVLLKDNHFWL